MARIALLGDRREHRSHLELDALRPRLGADTEWVPTDSDFDLAEYDALWLVPGSPYADDGSVLRAIRAARTTGLPFLGSCGGLQYAVLESAEALLGLKSTHAETSGTRDDNVVTPLSCPLVGEERTVVPVPGSWFATLCPTPFTGMHFCSFAPTPEVVTELERVGVTVEAHAEDAGPELLRWPNHRFFVGTLFQPHVGALAGEPMHPLVDAFVTAASD